MQKKRRYLLRVYRNVRQEFLSSWVKLLAVGYTTRILFPSRNFLWSSHPDQISNDFWGTDDRGMKLITNVKVKNAWSFISRNRGS